MSGCQENPQIFPWTGVAEALPSCRTYLDCIAMDNSSALDRQYRYETNNPISKSKFWYLGQSRNINIPGVSLTWTSPSRRWRQSLFCYCN